MVVVKVVLIGNNRFFAVIQHIAAVITDLETNRQYLLNFPFGSYSEQDWRSNDPNKAMQLYHSTKNSYCIATVNLYSDKNYDDFLAMRQPQPQEYAWLSNNCANVIANMLDFFFDNLPSVDQIKLLLGTPNYFNLLTPSWAVKLALRAFGVKTPGDVFLKAELLANCYGEDSLSKKELLQITEQNSITASVVSGTELRNDDNFDEYIMKRVLKPWGWM